MGPNAQGSCEQLRAPRPEAGHRALQAAGHRQPHRAASRLPYPARSGEEATALAQAILEVKERIGLCEVCFNLADAPRCRICGDQRRDHTVICVVEEPSDVIPMERTHEFEGVYHVLGGALSPIDGVDPEDLKISELYARVAVPSAAGAPCGARRLCLRPTPPPPEKPPRCTLRRVCTNVPRS